MVKRFFFYGLLVSINFLSLNASEWMKTYGLGEGRCVKQTSDWGYIITGRTGDSYDYRLCLIKTDSLGNTLWTKSFGDTLSVAYHVQQTHDGGYIITGEIEKLWWDIYLVKTDSVGNLMWEKHWGNSNPEVGYSVWQTEDKGYIIAVGSGWADLIKTDSLGNILWTSNQGICGEYGEPTLDGGFILTGAQHVGDPNGFDIFLEKLDSLGNLLWINYFNYPCTTFPVCHDFGYHVTQTEDGGYIVVGTATEMDIWLIKTDSFGHTIWTQAFDYQNSFYEWGYCVQQTFDNGFIVTGATNGGDFILLKTDSVGNLQWVKTFVGGRGFWVEQTKDSGYVATGDTFGLIFLMKTPNWIKIEERESETLDFKGIRIIPNPTISSTSIEYCITSETFIEVIIYDIGGRIVQVLDKSIKKPGSYKIFWDSNHFPAGVYFCGLREEGILIDSKKIIVIK